MTTKYMAVFHDGKTTIFTPTQTVEDAHAHLQLLLKDKQRTITYTVSIVEVGDDRMLYYKTIRKSFGTLASLNDSVAKSWQAVVQSIHSALSQLTPSFSNRSIH